MARTARVLVVDDDPLVAESLRLVLSAEFSVVVTINARDALQRITDGDCFDVILCDVMMPEMNGVELRDRIDGIDGEQAARIVFITGGIVHSHVRSLLERVPNTWIEKPIDIEGLRELVRRRARMEAAPWRVPSHAI